MISTTDATETHDGARPLIYVVEDDVEVARTVCAVLKEHGYRTEQFRRGVDLLSRIKHAPAALCIVDLGLPDMDGLQVVKDLQAKHETAILILTGRRGTSDRVAGLEVGADDYVVKPFEPRELVARVRSILRRYERVQGGESAIPGAVARFAGWSFDPARNLLTAPDGTELTLSAAEARLLGRMLQAPNRILSRDYLLEVREATPYDRSIDVRISRLRHKLEADPNDPQIIKTVYGAGYIFCANVEWA